MSEQPKPCPFCGMTPMIFFGDLVGCSSPDCFASQMQRVEHISRWNRRVPPPETARLLEWTRRWEDAHHMPPAKLSDLAELILPALAEWPALGEGSQ